MNPRESPGRGLIARIFTSPDEPRLRAGWRLLIQFLFLSVFQVILALIFLLAGLNVEDLIYVSLISLITYPSSIWLARRFLDRRSFLSLGLQWNGQALKDVLWGILITGGMMGLIFLIEWAAGWLRFEAFAWEQAELGRLMLDVGEGLVIFIIIGLCEELHSRGYHLQNLAEGASLFWGVVLSSAIFALLHGLNPDFSLAALVGLFFSGLFLAYGYVRTRQLWLPIGLHIGWNFFEGVVFSFPVSGLTGFPRLLLHQVTGPSLITGGRFGPEAGLILLPALLLGTACLYWITRRRTWPSSSR